jgi:hypothetical protein
MLVVPGNRKVLDYILRLLHERPIDGQGPLGVWFRHLEEVFCYG